MNKLRRIGPKMLLSLLTTFIIVFGIFVVLVITRTTALADSMARDLVLNTGKNYANQMAIEFNKTDELVLGLKFAAEQYETIPVEKRRDYIDGLLEKSLESSMTVVVGLWACFEPNQLDGMDAEYRNSDVSDATGRYISYFTDTNPSANGINKTCLTGYDTSGTGDYYLVAYETGKPYVTQPYDYEIDGEIVSLISIAYPIMDSNGKTVGVIGGDYNLEYINTLNDQVKLYETGFGKLVTELDSIVAHVDRDLIETLDQDLIETTEIKAVLQVEGAYVNKLYSTVLGANSYKAYTQVPIGNSGINWVYGVVVSEAEVMSQTNQLVKLISAVGIIGLLFATLIIVFLSRSIANPIKAMCKITENIAGGDLSVNVPEKYQKHKDEIGDLSKNLQVMRDSLVETVVGINNATISQQKQVSDMNAALSSLNDRIVDTSAATEELSASMEETGASAEEMNATAMEIERAVETVSEKAEEGAGKSGEISTRAAELDNSINDSINKSNDIFNKIKGSLEQALEDSKAVGEINALADAILGITSQTNLLALNASIEAARAGEAGKGFAVVADEIGLLANNSKNTVNQIQEITKVVMSAVNALSESSADLLDFVAKDVQNDYENMLESAKSYTDDAAYISGITSEFSTTSAELLTSIQTLAVTINEVSKAAQEGAGTTNIVAGKTTDISCNASTMVDNMTQTQRTSDELAALVSKFKVEQ